MSTAAPDYLRQQGFFDPAKHPHASVTFVGVGGIGSFASFAVAKLGVPNITLVDPDVVEAHNLPSQMFHPSHEGIPKVNAMAEQLESVTGVDVRIRYCEDYLEDMPKPQGVVVSGLDSMEARQHLWDQHLRMNPRVPLYIDGRIDGQMIVLYAIKPWDLRDVKEYEATLLSDDEVPAGLCTERAIIDVGFMLGSQIARYVRLHFTDKGDQIPKIMVVNQETMNITKGGWIDLD